MARSDCVRERPSGGKWQPSSHEELYTGFYRRPMRRIRKFFTCGVDRYLPRLCVALDIVLFWPVGLIAIDRHWFLVTRELACHVYG